MRLFRSDLPLAGDASARFLPWIIGCMVYLAALAVAVVAVIDHGRLGAIGEHHAFACHQLLAGRGGFIGAAGAGHHAAGLGFQHDAVRLGLFLRRLILRQRGNRHHGQQAAGDYVRNACH